MDHKPEFENDIIRMKILETEQVVSALVKFTCPTTPSSARWRGDRTPARRTEHGRRVRPPPRSSTPSHRPRAIDRAGVSAPSYRSSVGNAGEATYYEGHGVHARRGPFASRLCFAATGEDSTLAGFLVMSGSRRLSWM
eukprot:500501-Prorocentrum_minimum.AAC.1